MYEWFQKTFSNINNVIFSGILLILLLWGIISNVKLAITTKHLQRTESELGLIRNELSNAENRERELTETVGNIRDITERTDTLLDQSGTTIQNIREEIQVLEDYFRSVNQYLCTDDNNNNNISDSEE